MLKTLTAWRFILAFLIEGLICAACEIKSPAPQPTPSFQTTPIPSPASTLPPSPTTPPLAARVNSETILLSEYQAELSQLRAARQALSGLPDCLLAELFPAPIENLALDSLIAETLLAQAASTAGFRPSEVELRDRLENLKATASYLEWLKRTGYSEELLRLALRRSTAAAWQRQRIAEGVPEAVEQVRARQLLFTNREAAAAVLAALQSGQADLEELAFQRDPATGGDLGWFPAGYLTQTPVEAVAFGLAPGELSDLIETPLGWHILLVTGRMTRGLTPEARQAVQRQAMSSWIAGRRASAQIEVLVRLPEEQQPRQGAQEGPWYTVQEADSLSWIAAKMGLGVDELIEVNSLDGADRLAAGASLYIPGRGSYPQSLLLSEVARGEGLEQLSRRYLLPPALLARLNRWTSPAEAYQGAPLILPEMQGGLSLQPLPALEPGQSLLELAAHQNQIPWLIRIISHGVTPAGILPGEVLAGPIEGAGQGTSEPGLIERFTIDPLPLVQGSTVRVRIGSREPIRLSGELDGFALHFFPLNENEYIALQGVHPMSGPGLAGFSLVAQAESGRVELFEQSLLLLTGDYVFDPPLQVDPETIDPALTGPEEELVRALTAPATPEKLWESGFGVPVERWTCSPSAYGNRRSYNGSDYVFFHAGLDYGLCDNPSIFAPAAGVVVYTGDLIVRGQATLIDHGWGVYSGIWHQSEIYVHAGDRVERGQIIGKIGATGRVTGEHLHWEVWAGGVQVNPLDWLGQSFP